MRIKRPLIWVLGGWILGEIVAAGLGWQMTSASGLNLVMESRETLPVTVTGARQPGGGVRLRHSDHAHRESGSLE